MSSVLLNNSHNLCLEEIFYEDELISKKICCNQSSSREKTQESNTETCDNLSSSTMTSFNHINHKNIKIASAKKQKKIFQCHYEICLKTFKTKNSLSDHIRIHTGDKPFECQWKDCGKRFTQQSSLQKHVRIHKGEKPYKCKFEGCNLAFTQISNLKRHFRIHTNEKPYKCNQIGCNKAFNTSSNLKQHMDTHKNNQSRKKFQCDLCKKIYLYSANLKKHQKQSHDNNDIVSLFKCEEEQEDNVSVQHSEITTTSTITTSTISTVQISLNKEQQQQQIQNNNIQEEMQKVEESEDNENQEILVESISQQIAQLPIQITQIDLPIQPQQQQQTQQEQQNPQQLLKQMPILKSQQESKINLLQIFNASTKPIIIKHQDHADFLINGFLYSYNGKSIQVHQLESSPEFPDQCQQQIQILQHIQIQQQQQYGSMDKIIDDFFSFSEAEGESQFDCDNCCCCSDDFNNNNFDNCLECINSNNNNQQQFYNHNEYQQNPYQMHQQQQQPIQQQQIQQVHKHQLNCGHPMIFHNGHIDYLCNNKLHHQHNDHIDIHGYAEQIDVFSQQ